MNKEKHTKNRAKGFMSGVILLSASTLIVKLIGLAFKIPMLSLLGTEGMGYFNSAYEIYALLCIISTAGLPVALSMLVSAARVRQSGTEIKQIYRTALGLFLAFGICATALMLVFSKPLADFIGNPNAWLCIMAIAPALLFICIASALRGYCQGFENMFPTAASQLIEALSKLGFGILFAVLAIKKGFAVFEIAAYAVLGVTLGTLLSVIFLSFQKRKIKPKYSDSKASVSKKKGYLRELTSIALPITLGSTLLGITRITDMMLIMRRLQDIGISALDANKIYGAYTTLAVPVFSLIPALITPVAMALVPQLSSYNEEQNISGQANIIENSMRITVLLAMPASLMLSAFSQPILELLFFSQTEAISICAPLLSVLGASVVFSCLITTTNAILQSYRKAHLPILSMLAGVAVKCVSSYFLIGRENIGVLGAPIGSLLCNVTVTVINLWFMSRHTSCVISPIKVFFKPMAAAVLSVGAGFAFYVLMMLKISGGALVLFASFLLAVLIYLVFSWLIRSITWDDVALLPFGDRICKIFLKNKGYAGDGENDDCSKETDAS